MTLSTLLSPEGIVPAAALVTALIEVLKASFPALSARVSGALMAFLISAALYLLAGIAGAAPTADGAFLVFASWLACATAAIGIHGSASQIAKTASKAPGAAPEK